MLSLGCVGSSFRRSSLQSMCHCGRYESMHRIGCLALPLDQQHLALSSHLHRQVFFHGDVRLAWISKLHCFGSSTDRHRNGLTFHFDLLRSMFHYDHQLSITVVDQSWFYCSYLRRMFHYDRHSSILRLDRPASSFDQEYEELIPSLFCLAPLFDHCSFAWTSSIGSLGLALSLRCLVYLHGQHCSVLKFHCGPPGSMFGCLRYLSTFHRASPFDHDPLGRTNDVQLRDRRILSLLLLLFFSSSSSCVLLSSSVSSRRDRPCSLLNEYSWSRSH